jgi:hypothetical protein
MSKPQLNYTYKFNSISNENFSNLSTIIFEDEFLSDKDVDLSTLKSIPQERKNVNSKIGG